MVLQNGLVLPHPDFSKFDLNTSINLLDLVDESHELFDATKNGWDEWKTDEIAIPDSQQRGYQQKVDWVEDYEILKHLIDKTGRNWDLVGFIARSRANRNTCFVVFRGTSTASEWLDNIRIMQDGTENDGDVEIHRGFYTTIIEGEDSLRKQINTTLERLLSDGVSKIFTTGHSRGGALATVASYYIKLDLENLLQELILYSFASPRVGDSQFAEKFDLEKCFRIANSEDLVPKLPLPTLEIASLSNIPFINLLLSDKLIDRILDSRKYNHIGQSIYFTAQKDSIANNHTIPVYKDALRIAKTEIS